MEKNLKDELFQKRKSKIENGLLVLIQVKKMSLKDIERNFQWIEHKQLKN